MEKLNFVKNGVIRLPPGFRFHPTDEELILQYLRRKVYSFPLPASIIPDVDVCKSDPWDLPGDLEQERYFFSTREAKYPNGNRSNRATVSGYWKATGIDRQVVATNQVVGMKKTLVFYRGKPPHGAKTDWIMHEYRLDTARPTQKIDLNQSAVTPPARDDWVLCRIFLKKRNTGKNNDDEHHNVNVQTANYDRTEDSTVTTNSNKNKPEPVLDPIFYDFMATREKTDTGLNLAPTSPYSGSSDITELSICNGPDEHEESSCNTNSNPSFPSYRRKP